MIIKSLLKYSYRVIEVLLILSITALIIFVIGRESHDKAEMVDGLNSIIFALLWMWFISLPLFVIIVASLIRSIPQNTLYKKAVLSLHIFNVLLWILFYLFLPQPEPCDAAIMEEHYKNHHDEMYDLVEYVRNSLDDSCLIVLHYRNDEIQKFIVKNQSERKECTSIENKLELDTILHTAGLSVQELTVIQEKMHKAGVIGIEIGKNARYISDCENILLFRWHGVNLYRFALYDHPMSEEEKRTVLSLYQFIFYNDSVVFESYGGYPGMRGFPDRDEFLSSHH
jgi:hypothetical protein